MKILCRRHLGVRRLDAALELSRSSELHTMPVLASRVLLTKKLGWRRTKAASSRRTPRRFAHFHGFWASVSRRVLATTVQSVTRVAPFLSLSSIAFPFEASVRFAQEALILLFLVLNLR